MLAEKEDRQRKDLKKRERERKMLEMGDNYESNGEDLDSLTEDYESEQDSDYNSEDLSNLES
eukprot:CAMPEP_0116879810 /NCGR_PEP_ID=MMETSP0463-20121206/11646_1 /TAXON_ID=181622 /ORGANISM="Strombidinopsis sp, Strain SopsisLIS2011" /LENGTH=61 /DNA_ID=CAMNT_0004529575 /DNA_START=240 /DNA_END=425 /DNA_ORIENTATION=+